MYTEKKTLSFLAILLCLCQSAAFRKVRWPLKTPETHPGKVLVGIQKKKMAVITYEGGKPHFSFGLCRSLPQQMCSDELWGS